MNGVVRIRRSSQADPDRHTLARPVTLPLDVAELYLEWERAEDARLVANDKLRLAVSPCAKAGARATADSTALRVERARSAFATAMRAAAEARR